LEPVRDDPQRLPPGLLPETTSEAADVQLWSELYRATFVLRTAVRLALFDRLNPHGKTTSELAAGVSTDASLVERLCRCLQTMGLVESCDKRWVNSGLAVRTLLTSAAAYQGDMVLHNSRPSLIHYWQQLAERFGLPPDEPNPGNDFERFTRAMENTAAGSQRASLLGAVDLSLCKSLLDIGG